MREKPVYPLLEKLARGRVYGELIAITDDVDEAAEFIETHPPRHVPGGGWSFCGAHCADREVQMEGGKRSS